MIPRPELLLASPVPGDADSLSAAAASGLAGLLLAAALVDGPGAVLSAVLRLLNLPILRDRCCSLLLIRNAAVCRAVAAAARRAICARCAASFVAQSGLTRSVVTTFGALADSDCVRLLLCPMLVGDARDDGERLELSELLLDMAVPMVPMCGVGLEYVRPRRNGGGSYVTPSSGCWQ